MKQANIVRDALGTTMNLQVLRDFFTCIASGQFFDGRAHQLYLDVDSGELFAREASSLSLLSDSDSVILVTQLMGRCDVPEEELYRPGLDLDEFGFTDWVADVTQQLQMRMEPIPSQGLMHTAHGGLQ